MELSQSQLDAIKRVEARLKGEKELEKHSTKKRKYFSSRTPEIPREEKVTRKKGTTTPDPGNSSVGSGTAELRRHAAFRKDSGSGSFDKEKLSALIERLTGIRGSTFMTENANRGLFLDSQQTNASLSAKKRKRKRRRELDLKADLISRKQRREIIKHAVEKITYSMLTPMNEQWHKYADPLFSKISERQQKLPRIFMRTCSLSAALQLCETLGEYSRLLKQLEFHGCEIRAQTRSQQNAIEGFVFRNGKHTFSLVTKEDKIKIVPKSGTEFSFQVNGNRVGFWGDQIM
uniref:Uncharacterized protein n=1 Tax=Aplanochytrium stocchinoi TaxID=215587 RepID=A0A7S3V0L1_9STRA